MTIAFKQLLPYASGSSPATTGSFTPNAAGDALIEFALNPSGNSAISFSGGSTWSSIASGINPDTAVGVSLPCAAGAQTVTMTATSANFHSFGIEYSGVGSVSAPTPTFQVNPGTGTGAILGNAVTVPVGSVLLALCVNFDSGTNTITSPSGTNRGNGLTSDNFEFCITEYAGAGASITPSFTSADGATERFSVMQVLMTPAIAASSGPNPLFRMALPFAPLGWIIRRRQQRARERKVAS
jgi:hypothetical protein